MKIARLAALSILMLANIVWAFEPGAFYTDGKKDRRQIALTFDDGPGGEFTARVLDILDQEKVKATFFMNGDQVELRPKIAQEVKARGYEIADHTFSHENFYAYEKKNGVEKTKEKVRSEMKKSKASIEKHTGVVPVLCRMPNGYNRPWLKEIAREFGYSLVNWTFGEDWLKVPQDKLAADYLQHVRPGSILLFHDGGLRREKTVAILPAVIAEARRKNLEIVTVGELLK